MNLWHPLDPASAQDTLDILRSLADEGMAAILMVEHRVEDVLKNPSRTRHFL